MSTTPVTTMSSSPLVRHWQWLSLRARRTRRAVPSLLVIIFVIAVTTILFFPNFDASSFFSPPADIETRQREQLILQEDHHFKGDTKDPPMVELEDDVEPVVEPVVGPTKDGLDADDPLIVKIDKLRRELAANYKVDYWRGARSENDGALERLSTCLQAGSCGSGEENVVLLATFHFGHAKLGMVSGEDIWARSSIEAFTALNYTLLYTYGHMDTLLIYQHIPENVKTIIWEGEQLRRCMARNETYFDKTAFPGDELDHSPGDWQNDMKKGCIKTDGFEDGIPLWKSFSFHFWPTNPHPLGEKWTLAPYDYNQTSGMENFFLGYSIEEGCEKIPLVQNKKHRAIVLGKRPEYFTPEKLAWPDMLPEVAGSIPAAEVNSADGDEFDAFQFVGAYTKDKNSEVISKQGVETVGKLTMAGWFEAVGASKAMLGIGEPYLSPSPFDGLCQGTPFINVIRHWDKKDPENKKEWRTQHDPLLSLGAPYVYHVQKGNKDALAGAIQSSVDNPIGRYIPPTMTRESVRDRHRKLVEADWQTAGRMRIQALGDEDRPFLYIA